MIPLLLLLALGAAYLFWHSRPKKPSATVTEGPILDSSGQEVTLVPPEEAQRRLWQMSARFRDMGPEDQAATVQRLEGMARHMFRSNKLVRR